MGTSLKEIVEQARKLPTEDRATLAQSLLESLDAPIAEVESAWAEEIEHRVAAYDRGELKPVPAEDVFAEARRLTR